MLVEAAWYAARTPGRCAPSTNASRARRGGNIATVAVARKLAVIAWHMLSRGEDYAFARPSLDPREVAPARADTGAERQKGKRIVPSAPRSEQHRLEQGARRPSRAAYRRLVARLAARNQARARVPHRGAHLRSAEAASSAAGHSPTLLRFSSRSPAPTRLSQRAAIRPAT